ncbi:MAG: hypothetical protein LBG66_01730 [Gallionellaceae bacterium]|jgi:hypothetical protein|nr:hypothetical protein [Gallionellaceae bacterium]
MNNEEVALFPVATITAGPIPEIDAVIIRFDFLTHGMQRPDEAQAGRNYALSPVQARYLVEKISSALTTLDNAASQGDGAPKH